MIISIDLSLSGTEKTKYIMEVTTEASTEDPTASDTETIIIVPGDEDVLAGRTRQLNNIIFVLIVIMFLLSALVTIAINRRK